MPTTLTITPAMSLIGHNSGKDRASRNFHELMLKFSETDGIFKPNDPPFRMPHCTTSPSLRGDLETQERVVEWWNKEKKLTIYCANSGITYVKVWGANPNTEMQDGNLTDETLIDLWRWLEG